MAPTRATNSASENGPAAPPSGLRSRRFAGVFAGVFLAGLAVAGLWWYSSRASSVGGPRGPVILVVVDTLRADRLAVYGYPAGRTPVLAAFAREGVVFDRAYAHAPQTLPSHASMFTGHLPFEHAVRDNLGFTLKTGPATLAEMFRAAGYKTAGFVSAYVLRPETGIARGFDVYDATFPPMAADRSVAQVQRPGPQTLAAADAWLQLADV